MTLVVSGFNFFQCSYSKVIKQSSLPTNFRITEPLNKDYVIHLRKPKKGPDRPVFSIKILVTEIFDCFKYCMAIFHM